MEIIEHRGNLIKEIVYEKKLNNGLKVFYMPKKGYTKQYAMFATNFGSNELKFKTNKEDDVYEVPEGIAHFLEHKMFEEPEGNAFDKFAARGANVNAYTNFNITAYYFTSTDHFYENLKDLISFVQSPYFTTENVEKEKGIIAQEIKMYDDNPDWKVYFNLLKSMYKEHTVKNEIAGTVESVNKITKEDLYNCYNTFYHPSNMAVFIVGDLDKDKVFKTIENYFKDDSKNSERIDIERYYPVESRSINQTLIEEEMSISTPLFYIGYKDIDLDLKGRKLLEKEVELRLLLDIIFGKSSELFEDLYDKGLIDDSFGGEYSGDLNYGHTIIGGKSKNPKEVLKITNNYIEKKIKEGLNKEDFQRIKKKQIGENLSYFNSIEFIGSSFISYFFKGINFIEYIDVLKETSFEKVEERFKNHFLKERQVLSIIKGS